MDGAKQFIEEARAKGTDDEHIRQLLKGNGWSETQIDAALKGLTVPLPPQAPGVPVPPSPSDKAASPDRPSISALEAALHHVLLWLFTGTSSVMIGIVSAALFGSSDGSSETLLTYVVMEMVTFLPFLALFGYYLRHQKRQPELTTGKVWSIITIVFHSVGTLASIIAFILVIILVHSDNSSAALAASGAIAIMDALVVVAYVLANFTKTHNSGLHRKVLFAFPAALFVLIAIFGIVALLRVGPLRADDQTRQHLVDTAKLVHTYASSKDKLPASGSDISGLPSGVSYTRTSYYKYQLCGTLKKGTTSSYASNTVDDSYPSNYDFHSAKSGYNCWTVTNQDLEYKQNNTTSQCDNTYWSNSCGLMKTN